MKSVAAGKMFDFQCVQKVFVFSMAVLLMAGEFWLPVNAAAADDVKSDEDNSLVVLAKYKPWDVDNSPGMFKDTF